MNRDVPPKAIGGLASPSWKRGQFSCVRHVISRTKCFRRCITWLIDKTSHFKLQGSAPPHPAHCWSSCYGEAGGKQLVIYSEAYQANWGSCYLPLPITSFILFIVFITLVLDWIIHNAR